MERLDTRTRLARCSRIYLFSGCLIAQLASAAQPEANYYEDALRRFDAQDVKGAIVQLKNALQQNPRLLPAQVLLAESYLITGSPAAAEVALEAAEKLGADRVVTAPKFAQAYIRQFKYQLLLDRVSPQGLPPVQAAEVLIQRSAARIGLGQLKQAEEDLRQAARLSPDSVAVKVAQGTLALQKGDMQNAQDLADKAVALGPNDAGVWNLKASIAHLRGDTQSALSAYGKALSLNPGFVDARVARAGLLMDINRKNEAEDDLKALEPFSATDPRAAYLVSLSAASRGDAEATRKALANATAILDQLPPEMVNRNAQLLMLGGLAHYGLREPEKARSYLQGYIALQPRQPGARKLLAAILLDSGDNREVIQLLYPMTEGRSPDPQVLTMLASAYLGRKQYAQAADLFEQAAKLAPDSADAAVGLGMTHLEAGQVGQGIAELQQIFAKDPGQARAGLVLATNSLRQGKPGQAVEILRKIVARDAKNLIALNLLGTALLANKDAAGARSAFTKAAVQDPNFLPVQINIARLDLAEGREAQARKRLSAILKYRADYPEALFLLARLEERQGRADESIRLLERIRAGKTKPMQPMLYLADHYLKQGNSKSALSVVQDLEAEHPENLAVLEALGRIYIAGGSVDKARASFNRMVRYAGFDSAALTRVAGLLMGVGSFDDAGHALNKALGNNAAYLPAQMAQVELELRTGRLAAAEKRAAEMRVAHPGQASIARLLGTVYMAQKKTASAITEFKAAVARERNGANTLALFQAYLEAREGKAAIDLMQAWLRDNPRDIAAEAALAEAYLRMGDLAQARSTYLSYLKLRPNDASALNNLANIAFKLKDPQALSYAQQAQALAPADPNVADTLGWILVRQGQAQKALPYLRDARLRAASNPVIQYHLGVALLDLGRKAEGKRELQGALAVRGGFEGQEEARRLVLQP